MTRALYVAWFLLALSLFTGAAGQGISCLVLWFFVTPIGFYYAGCLRPDVQIQHRRAGILLVSLYLVFVASNVINYFLYADVLAEVVAGRFKTKQLIQGRFAAGVFFSGLVMWVLSYIAPFLPQKTRAPSTKDLSAHLTKVFHAGMLSASALLGIYCIIQMTTGFDYHPPAYRLGEEKIMGFGLYRAMGFYGHTLSLASVSLALFSYYYYLAWRAFSGRERKTAQVYALISALQLIIQMTTASRLSMVICIAVMIGTPFLFKLTKQWRIWRTLVLVLGLTTIAVFVGASGMHQRFLEFFSGDAHLARFGDRQVFWQVYWELFRQKPWIGQGFCFLQAGLKAAAYQHLGLQNIVTFHNAHNIYLETLACAGAIGLTAVIYILYCLRRTACFFTNANSDLTGDFRALQIAFGVNLVHGLTQNTLFDANVCYVYLGLFWFYWWLTFVANRAGRTV